MDPSISPELAEIIWKEAIYGMATVNKDGVILEVNPKLCEILGYTRGGLIGKTFRDITHPDDFYMDDTEFTRLCAGEIDKYGMFKRYITRDGQIVGLRLKVVAVRRDGNIELVLGQVSDALKVIPLDEAQIKKAASATLGQFIIEHWRIVLVVIVLLSLGSNAGSILKLFF